ncbi:MAG: hypothetical protein PHR06_16315 [Candidatus Cloacimonetes bacterium]|nr:hypothetical protein [Candidatus Cloacimonadota bacterium]
MQIAALMKGGKETGDQIIILSRTEAQNMYGVYVKYCEQNPRMKNAKKVFKQFEDELKIF